MPDDKCILDPERDCIGKAAAAKLEARIEALEGWQKDSKEFHHAFYDWQREQIARDSKLDEKLSAMESNIGKLVTWQESQQAQPAKRWETIIAAVITGVVGFLLARFGL